MDRENLSVNVFYFFILKVFRSIFLSLPLLEANRLVLDNYFTSHSPPPPYKCLILCPLVIDLIGYNLHPVGFSNIWIAAFLALLVCRFPRFPHGLFEQIIKEDKYACQFWNYHDKWQIGCLLLWWLNDYLEPESLLFFFLPVVQLIDCFKVYGYMRRAFKGNLYVVKDGSRRLVLFVIENREGQWMGFSRRFEGFNGFLSNISATVDVNIVMEDELMPNLLGELQVTHPHLRMVDIMPRCQTVFNSVTQASQAVPFLNTHLLALLYPQPVPA